MFIYKITNLVNGKIYIGQTIQEIEQRFYDHCHSGAKLLIQRAIRKYGKENFTIEQIDSAKTLDELNEKEVYWIKFYNSTDRKIGYNITSGGNHAIMPEEYVVKRVANRFKNNPSPRAWFDAVRQRWSYSVIRNNIEHCVKNFKTKEDALIARDIKLLDVYPRNLAVQLLTFPENLDKYLNKEIVTPERDVWIEKKKSKYRFVGYDKKNDLWYICILKDGKRIKKKGMYSSEEIAAEVGDYFYAKLIAPNKSELNFPNRLNEYLKDDYKLPLTSLYERKSTPYRSISFVKETNRFAVDTRPFGFKYRKHCKTLDEAKILRDKALLDHNIPIPD